MEKKKSTKKEIEIAANVRLLKCGKWGYILNEKAIFKSTNVETVNLFSKWVFDTVLKEAERMQLLEGETDVMPQVFEVPNWNGAGHNYEAQTKIPKL